MSKCYHINFKYNYTVKNIFEVNKTKITEVWFTREYYFSLSTLKFMINLKLVFLSEILQFLCEIDKNGIYSFFFFFINLHSSFIGS